MSNVPDNKKPILVSKLNQAINGINNAQQNTKELKRMLEEDIQINNSIPNLDLFEKIEQDLCDLKSQLRTIRNNNQ